MFIVTKDLKVYHIWQEKDSDFEIKSVKSFAHHNLTTQLIKLAESDWVHIFVNNEEICIDNSIYSLSAYLKKYFTVPNNYIF